MVAFVFFYIRFGSPLLKEKNLFRKRKIGLNTQISLLPRRGKKKSLNLDCKGRFGGHQVVFFLPFIWRFGGH